MTSCKHRIENRDIHIYILCYNYSYRKDLKGEDVLWTLSFRFLYDYRQWCDLQVPAELRLERLRSYLEAWRVPPESYALRLAKRRFSPHMRVSTVMQIALYIYISTYAYLYTYTYIYVHIYTYIQKDMYISVS